MISGVVREDEGVGIFLGSTEGDLEEVRFVRISGWEVGGVFGMGGGPCSIDSLFALFASVGLTVLAPSPVACEEPGNPGITDILFADEEGVVVPLPFALPGDLPAKEADLLCSGVLVETVKCVCPFLEGGCKDFVFAARDAVNPLAPSAYVGAPATFTRVDAFPESDSPCAEEFDAKLGLRLCAGLE